MKDEDFYREKREFVRYGLKARGELVFENEEIFNGVFLDVSVAGAYFETTGINEEAVNQFVTISMNVQIKGELHNMRAQCKVVRVTNTGVGLLFGKMDDASKNTFHALMQELRDNLLKDDEKNRL